LFISWGDPCAICAYLKHRCNFSDRYFFLETLRLFRDTECLKLSKNYSFRRNLLPNSFTGTLAERQLFLITFYSAVKATFPIFEYYTRRAELVMDHGRSALIQRIPDAPTLNLAAALASRLDASAAFMALLDRRSEELGQDVDTFRATVFLLLANN